MRTRLYCERTMYPSWFFQSATGSLLGVVVQPTRSFCPSGPVKRAPASSVDWYFHPLGSPILNPWPPSYVCTAVEPEEPDSLPSPPVPLVPFVAAALPDASVFGALPELPSPAAPVAPSVLSPLSV
ncbi:hypothetical protein ACFWIZ_38210 [Streptomyces sp. NPDC127044]